MRPVIVRVGESGIDTVSRDAAFAQHTAVARAGVHGRHNGDSGPHAIHEFLDGVEQVRAQRRWRAGAILRFVTEGDLGALDQVLQSIRNLRGCLTGQDAAVDIAVARCGKALSA